MKKTTTLLLLLIFAHPIISFSVLAQNNTEYELKSDILYTDSEVTTLTPYAEERCRLDIYYPKNKQHFATVVWFHGGGIRAGNKFIPEELKEKGIAVVAANYRLNPKVQAPVYIEDAASAIAWTMKHIGEYGGDPSEIYVSGHSAGGYLASMVGMDTTYLQKHGLRANDLAGIISYSGHAITHFTIRSEMGLDWHNTLIDRYAPLSHIRKDIPPLVLILGDREKELFGRYEEVAYLWRMMQLIGHPFTKIYEIEGYTHGEMAVPAHHILLNSIKEIQAWREGK